jgi:hypothetical protein
MQQAKRRYKVLVREQERLTEKGQRDAQVDSQIAQLVAEFPDLVETKPTISESTKSLLSFGEHMAAAELPAQPRAAVAAATDATQPTAPNAEHGDRCGHSHGVPKDDVDAALARPPDVTQGKPRQDEASPANILRAFAVAAVALRVMNDLRARPTTTPAMLGTLAAAAFLVSAFHALVLDELCSWTALATSPTVFVVAAHALVNRTVPQRATKSQRSIIERALVYAARDIIPCLAVTWVVYLFGLVFAGVAMQATPKRYC